jgi:N-terminal domain of anti-restriction factor ArdC
MQEFADRIVTELEKGVKPWVRPWDPEKAGGPQAPFNPVTGKRYHGINVLILGMDMRAFQSGDPRWMTYQQAHETLKPSFTVALLRARVCTPLSPKRSFSFAFYARATRARPRWRTAAQSPLRVSSPQTVVYGRTLRARVCTPLSPKRSFLFAFYALGSARRCSVDFVQPEPEARSQNVVFGRVSTRGMMETAAQDVGPRNCRCTCRGTVSGIRQAERGEKRRREVPRWM